MKTNLEIHEKLKSLETKQEKSKILFEWVKTGVIKHSQFYAIITCPLFTGENKLF